MKTTRRKTLRVSITIKRRFSPGNAEKDEEKRTSDAGIETGIAERHEPAESRTYMQRLIDKLLAQECP